jgi:serine/threonine protein phosphatase PrpC
LLKRESPFRLEVAGATHIGGRRSNEDHYRYDAELGLLAVADGVSMRPAGRVAAEAAIAALFEYLSDPNMTSPADPRERIERAFGHVNRQLREQAAADEELRGMATTLACVLERGTLLLVGHVGDSRVVRLRDGRPERLTTDHQLKTDLDARSRLTAEEIQREDPESLTRAIGLQATIAPDVCIEALRPNDGILVTSDGLTAVVDDDTIAAVVQHYRTPEVIVDQLIQCALTAGAPDNVTCVYGHWRPLVP